MANRSVRLVAAIFAAAVLVSCADSSSPSVSTPVASPTGPTPTASHLSVSVADCGRFRAGEYYPLACIAQVSDDNPPASADYMVNADLRVLGGAAEAPSPTWGFPRCPACGGPGRTFDIDLHIPADTTPGLKTFRVWVTDSVNGRRAETTARLEIIPR